MQLSPYLLFNGDCEQALKYYEQALGGKIEAINNFRRITVGGTCAC